MAGPPSLKVRTGRVADSSRQSHRLASAAPATRAERQRQWQDDDDDDDLDSDKRALRQKWQQRKAFDQWRRRFARGNRAVLQRLYRSATYAKGLSVQKRRALARWVRIHDLRKQRQIARLQAVAELRLSMLLSDTLGATSPLQKTRKVAGRWSRPLAYETFHAWRKLYVATATHAANFLHLSKIRSDPPP
jgi:hypothetical protein